MGARMYLRNWSRGKVFSTVHRFAPGPAGYRHPKPPLAKVGIVVGIGAYYQGNTKFPRPMGMGVFQVQAFRGGVYF